MVEGFSGDIWIFLGGENRIDSMDGLQVGGGSRNRRIRWREKGDARLRDKIWGEKQFELRSI